MYLYYEYRYFGLASYCKESCQGNEEKGSYSRYEYRSEQLSHIVTFLKSLGATYRAGSWYCSYCFDDSLSFAKSSSNASTPTGNSFKCFVCSSISSRSRVTCACLASAKSSCDSRSARRASATMRPDGGPTGEGGDGGRSTTGSGGGVDRFGCTGVLSVA